MSEAYDTVVEQIFSCYRDALKAPTNDEVIEQYFRTKGLLWDRKTNELYTLATAFQQGEYFGRYVGYELKGTALNLIVKAQPKPITYMQFEIKINV